MQSKGFTLLETLIATALFAVVLFSAMTISFTLQDDAKDQVALSQFNEIESAAKKYIIDQYNTVYNSAVTPAVIPISTLTTAGYLKMGIQATNAYGQTHCVLVARSGLNLLGLVVTEGGTAISNNKLGQLVRSSKTVGMFNGTALEGVAGTWFLPNALTTFNNRNCSGITTSQGHLTSLLYFDSTAQSKDYMYRKATAGLPDRNTMHTDLDMGNKNINNVGTVNSKNIANAQVLTTNTTDITTTLNNTNTINASTYNNADTTEISGTLKTDNLTSLTNVVAGVNTVIVGVDSGPGPDPTYLYLNNDAFLSTRGGGTAPLTTLLPTGSSRGAYAVSNGTIIAKPSDCANSAPTLPYAKMELSVSGASMQTTVKSGVILDAGGNPYLWDGGTDYIKFSGSFSDSGAAFQTFFTEYNGPSQSGPWTPRSNNGKGIAHIYCVFS